MNDLRTLVDKIEDKRRQREIIRFGGALAAGGAMLVFLLMFLPQPVHPEPAVAVLPEPVDAYKDVLIEAKAAVVYDLVTGEVLYAKNADAQLPLASLTKLLTIYAGVNALGSGSVIAITDSSLTPEGDSGFVTGQTFAFTEIAKAALVASSNDAAEAIAETAASRRALSEPSLLANAASAAGLVSTYALNGTGLDENEIISGGYGSAKDIALLAGAVLERARAIAKATTQPTVTVSSLSGNTFTFRNTNPIVGKIPGLLLSKTGFTDLAGGNLAMVFDASVNHPIAVVVLGSSIEGRFTDSERLIRATLTSFVTLDHAI